MAKKHIDFIEDEVPDIVDRKVLDVGSGRGMFLVNAAKRGIDAYGLELYEKYIEITHERAKEAGVTVTVRQGVAEDLPYDDAQFGFVNVSEVIEHIEDPDAMLREVYRVLRPDGYVYMSVPSRFSYYDPHFHLYFVNWLPRPLAHGFAGLFGRHKKKDYTGSAGRQRLDEMHYFTYRAIVKKMKGIGFEVYDVREKKLRNILERKKMPLVGLCMAGYRLVRPLWSQAFHFYLHKTKKSDA